MENNVSKYAVGERPISEIISDLRKPISANHIKKKKISGRDILFIPWYHAVKYLDLYAPGWGYEIVKAEHIKDKIMLIVKITIIAADGFFSREATGNEEDVTSSYGDPFSNAESMALRRAASKFGLGLYMYAGETQPQRPQQPQQPQQPQVSGGMTENQSKAIYAICQSKDVDEAEFIDERFPGISKKDLTLTEASEIIELLKLL